MFSPLIALLRPVSPLAWLPIGLLLFQKAAACVQLDHFYLLNLADGYQCTAEGVRCIPQDYLNVARVLQLSEWTVMRKILFPAVLPAVLTGVRLSIGIAWLVIVAAEMLTGVGWGSVFGSGMNGTTSTSKTFSLPSSLLAWLGWCWNKG